MILRVDEVRAVYWIANLAMLLYRICLGTSEDPATRAKTEET